MKLKLIVAWLYVVSGLLNCISTGVAVAQHDTGSAWLRGVCALVWLGGSVVWFRLYGSAKREKVAQDKFLAELEGLPTDRLQDRPARPEPRLPDPFRKS